MLRIDSGEPDHPARDRFVLSKGHGPMAFYAVLAAKGFIPVETLGGFADYDSPLVTDASFTAVRHGSRSPPTVIAVGPMLDRVIAATDDMDVTVLYTATPHPLDARALRALMTAPDMVIAEPYLAGTSAAAICHALSDVPHRLLSIGVPNTEHRKYGTRDEYDAAHGIDTGGIRRKITEFAALRRVA